MKVYYVGHSPVAVHGIKGKTEIIKNLDDFIVPNESFREFFFRAQIVSGGIKSDEYLTDSLPLTRKYLNYQWLTKEEIEKILPDDYYPNVRDVLSN